MNQDIEIEGGKRHHRCRVNCRPTVAGTIKWWIETFERDSARELQIMPWQYILFFYFWGCILSKTPYPLWLHHPFLLRFLNSAYYAAFLVSRTWTRKRNLDRVLGHRVSFGKEIHGLLMGLMSCSLIPRVSGLNNLGFPRRPQWPNIFMTCQHSCGHVRRESRFLHLITSAHLSKVLPLKTRWLAK